MKTLLILLLTAGVYPGFSQQPADSTLDIRTLVSRHQYAEALEKLAKRKEDTFSIETFNLMGYCYSKQGMYREAVLSYQSALKLDSLNQTTLSRLADLYKGKEEFIKAHTLYNRLSREDSLNSYFYKQSAYCLYKSGLLPFAIPLYEQANRLNPDDEEVVMALAMIYFEQEEFNRCDSLLDRSLAGDTADTQLLSLKAKNKYYQKEYDSAFAALEAVFLLGDTSLSNIRLAGNALYALNEYDRSISWFERIPAELLEKDEYSQYMMGVSYRHLQRPEKSIAHLEKAIKLGISDNISFYYQQLGLSHEEKGEIDKALIAFETAGTYKEEGILDYQIARIYDYYRDDPATALEYYKRYLDSRDSSVQRAWQFSRQRVKQLAGAGR
ncbi:Tfp pilus assembly protein PilF [Anseongella ginsenosidimutans]|uniref:Tfp pilus assembly protein PilF n=1 Tax=Anseongella ginsenosidimutans TaxID=496056 RepID=A0A4R3KNB8_9SPHI|nr:tetratricopeptide repeat protein [Anseongella ginsenosidimutans]QEC53739.1 tetratricopeptide repeat protein [Anseongella ginsenosidimutans]TCS86005.1 Tfp pilus assembly protein PilF [Anseongella ginsenosidimutans]